VLALFFASGFAGLVYEVLWMKELGLLFGNTSQAAATTLAAFFLGLAAGGRFFGRRAARSVRPLRTYALLEVGVAVSALLYFVLLDAYQGIYAPLFAAVGDRPGVFLAVKFVLALVVLFPPAFFMGGTFPVMSQHAVRSPRALGRTAARFYAVNTLGAALGAYVAGFHLPALLGFTNSYLIAIAMTMVVAATATSLARSESGVASPVEGTEPPASAPSSIPAVAVWSLAFLSGAVTLALEVLWTRMFAQVLQNSVYTFSAILVVFLACLALGAGLASRIARREADPPATVIVLLLGAAGAVAVTPLLFVWSTDGLVYLGGSSSWPAYVAKVFGSILFVIGIPTLVLGTLFPYLLKVGEVWRLGAGRTVGDLVAVNTFGAILGALAAGFLLLELLGLWKSIWLLAIVYLIAVLLLPAASVTRVALYRGASLAGLAVLAVALVGGSLPLVRAGAGDGARLEAVWEGSAATVAVVREEGSLKIKLNNYYSLGGTDAAKWEAWQAHLPLLLHPDPRSVFFLGMGTGITAGAALGHDVERVVVTEIVPEVVEAARGHFAAHTNGLFDDRRVRVVAEDGRNYLRGTRERFDVAIADLFMPWKAGVGSLYTREHYASARARLTESGLYVQWLPLYQMSAREFGVIARTMVSVFPQVTLWRGDFFSRGPIVALVGHANEAPLDPSATGARLARADPAIRELPLRHFVPDLERAPGRVGEAAMLARTLLYYCGNLGAAPDLLAAYPVNTDDMPVVEYRAPIAERAEAARGARWFAMRPLIAFLSELLATVPPEQDPFLASRRTPGRETSCARASICIACRCLRWRTIAPPPGRPSIDSRASCSPTADA
jgi:spermidine synthase